MIKPLMAAVAVLLFVAPFSYAGGSSDKNPTPAPSTPSAPAPAPAPAAPRSPYFTGDGGMGMSLAVLVPSAQGIAADQNYLPTMVQGVLVGDLTKYSAISVLDRLRLETVLRETESGIYKNEDDFGRLGQIANVDYALTGSITKTGSGYAMQVQVVGTGKETIGVTKAAYSGSFTIAELDNFTGIRKASLELLTQLGVNVSAQTRQELSAASSAQTVSAQTALAQGITSQRGGTVVDALSHFIQANNYDPSSAEAASRLNILSTNISSGNIGEDVRNDLQWRDQWVARLRECEEFYANYLKEALPYYLVYSPRITQGAVDYQRRTVTLTVESLAAYPDIAWFSTLNQVVKTVKQGLTATNRAAVWGLDNWPVQSISSPNPFENRVNFLQVEMEILNSEGRSIAARETVVLPYGWEAITTRNYPEERARMEIHYAKPVGGIREVVFPAADPNAITDNLSIRITAIDGIQAETAARQKRINILTASQYAGLPNARNTVQSPGSDNSTWSFFRIDSRDYRAGVADMWVLNYRTGTYVPERREIAALKIQVGDSFVASFLIGLFIPNGVTRIYANSFEGGYLTSVTIPGSVIQIAGAFRDHPLTSITIGANVQLEGRSFPNSFYRSYFDNGRKAGTYTYNGQSWSYRAR